MTYTPKPEKLADVLRGLWSQSPRPEKMGAQMNLISVGDLGQ